MASRTRSRAIRKLRGSRYVRLWAYMDKQDRVYALCAFHMMHEDAARNLRRGDTLVKRASETLAPLGLTGRILSRTLDALAAIRPADVLQCEFAIRRGPTDDPGLVR